MVKKSYLNRINNDCSSSDTPPQRRGMSTVTFFLNKLGKEGFRRNNDRSVKRKAISIDVRYVKADLKCVRNFELFLIIVKPARNSSLTGCFGFDNKPGFSIFCDEKIDLSLFFITEIIKAVFTKSAVGPELNGF